MLEDFSRLAAGSYTVKRHYLGIVERIRTGGTQKSEALDHVDPMRVAALALSDSLEDRHTEGFKADVPSVWVDG
jgi:hypothetical protein